MKTNISIRFLISTFLLLGTLFVLALYNPFEVESTPNIKPQPVFFKKHSPFPSLQPIANDSIVSDSISRPQEQSIKKLDIKILKRSLYLHRKPLIV